MLYAYRPKFANGTPIKLSFPVAVYRILNNICWPLENDAPFLVRVFDILCYVMALTLFILFYYFMYLLFIETDITLESTLGSALNFMLILDITLHAFHTGYLKKNFKIFLEKFYTEIYIDGTTNVASYRYIKRKLMPTYAYTVFYFTVLLSFFALPIVGLIRKQRLLIYPSAYPFDYTPIYIYLPVIMTHIWMGIIIITTLSGDMNLLSEIILHLNERFLHLKMDLMQEMEKVLSNCKNNEIAYRCRKEVIKILVRNAKLNEFTQEFQKMYNFRIFVVFFFSSAIICCLFFKVFTNPLQNIGNLLWMFAKIIEVVAIGELGSILITSTNLMSSIYYESKWETVIYRSTNTKENVKLMKTVQMAIELNQKPFYLTGFKFFSVSLTAVASIIRVAGSYFTCILSLT